MKDTSKQKGGEGEQALRRPLPTYDEEIEARRASYEQQAEALIQLLALQTKHVRPLLDLQLPGIETSEPEPHILIHAIDDHIDALFSLVSTYRTDDFLRTFYVELRLYYDQQRHKVEQRLIAKAQAMAKQQ